MLENTVKHGTVQFTAPDVDLDHDMTGKQVTVLEPTFELYWIQTMHVSTAHCKVPDGDLVHQKIGFQCNVIAPSCKLH